MLFATGFVPKDPAPPAGLENEATVAALLAKVWGAPAVDKSIFLDASVADKFAGDRDVAAAALGTFRGIVFERGSYFARFAFGDVPVFVYVTAAGKIHTLLGLPPVAAPSPAPRPSPTS